MPIPTSPGVWFRGSSYQNRGAVEVDLVDGVLMYGDKYSGKNKTKKVEDDGQWFGEATLSEINELYDRCSNYYCCKGYNHNGSCRDMDRD